MRLSASSKNSCVSLKPGVFFKGLGQFHLLGKVGQVLNDLGNKGQSPRRAVIRILLHQAEKTGRHNGWAKETEKQ